jgi:hypothetical protein
MTTTPNLAVGHIAAAQNQKEVTANAAFDALDNAGNRVLDVDVSAGNVTLTSDQFRRNGRLRAISATVAGRTITLPSGIQRTFLASVSSTSTAGVRFVLGSASAAIGPGQMLLLSTDGTANGLTQLVGSPAQRVVTETTTVRTLGLADAGAYLRCTSNSSVTITVPAAASVVWPVGTTISIEQAGTGMVAIAGASGVTVNRVAGRETETAGQYAVVSIVNVAADTWTLFGLLAETPE